MLPNMQHSGMGHPLQTFRQNKRLSQGQLAAMLGVDRTTIWRWETGVRHINAELVPVVSEKTGISPADLRPDLAELLKRGVA